MPDAGGLVIATDQTSARAYAETAARPSPAGSRSWCSATSPRAAKRSSVRGRPGPLDGGGPDGVGGRGHAPAGGRGVRDVRPPRRCSSPRRSAGSSGPEPGGRPRRCSCPACRTCCGTRPRLERERDHVRRCQGRAGRGGRCWPRRSGPRPRRTCRRAVHRAGQRGRLRPGGLRRRRVRSDRPGRQRRGTRLPRAAGAAGAEQVKDLLRRHQADHSVRAPGRGAAAPTRTCGSSARSSTGWSPPGITAPTCRTG